MKNLSLDQITTLLKKDLDAQIISGKSLLDRLCVINENSRKTSAYLDHRYAPFYYHLGKYIKAKSFLEIGFNIGLLSSCFLMSCKNIEKFFGFKENEKEFIPTRIGRINVKKFTKNIEIYIGNLYDDYFYKKLKEKWEIILINEQKEYDKQLEYMELSWSNLSDNGLLIVEYINTNNPSKKALDAFCQSQNIIPIIFNTKHGTALISNA